MKQTFSIQSKLTDLNTYINAERSHWSLAAKIKKNETEYCCEEIMVARLEPFKTPVSIHYLWYVSSMRPDPDNISFAKKFINDALEQMHIIKRDNLKNVRGLSDDFKFTSERKGVDVTLTSLDGSI